MTDNELQAALCAAFAEAIDKIGLSAFRRTSFFFAGRSATPVAEA